MMLDSCLGPEHTPCAYVTLGLCLSARHTPFTHVVLGLSAWGLGTPQHTRDAWTRQDPTILGPRMLQNPR